MMNAEAFNKTLENAEWYLSGCRCYGDVSQLKYLGKYLVDSMNAKSYLWELFGKSPHHNGRGQLVVERDEVRPIDRNAVYEFADYLIYTLYQFMYEPAKWKCYTANEMFEYRDNISRRITYFDRAFGNRHWIVNGVSREDMTREKNHWDELLREMRCSETAFEASYNNYVSMNSYNRSQNVLFIGRFVRDNCTSYIINDADQIKSINNKLGTNFRCGTKLNSIVQKAMKKIGALDKINTNATWKQEYNRKVAKFGDAITPITKKRLYVLSINPVDYLTMSFGKNWTSCLNTDKQRNLIDGGRYSDGFNSKRTLDYALDPTTMVMYTLDLNCSSTDYEIQPKVVRQLFHFDGNKLIQARLYPQGSTSRREVYDNHRYIVEELLAEAIGEKNLWTVPHRELIQNGGDTVKSKSDSHSFIDFLTDASHGGDENDFQREVNYVVFKGDHAGRHNGKPMTVGTCDTFCLKCGRKQDRYYSDSILCGNCY